MSKHQTNNTPLKILIAWGMFIFFLEAKRVQRCRTLGLTSESDQLFTRNPRLFCDLEAQPCSLPGQEAPATWEICH